jgi:hypothetical protein
MVPLISSFHSFSIFLKWKIFQCQDLNCGSLTGHEPTLPCLQFLSGTVDHKCVNTIVEEDLKSTKHLSILEIKTQTFVYRTWKIYWKIVEVCKLALKFTDILKSVSSYQHTTNALFCELRALCVFSQVLITGRLISGKSWYPDTFVYSINPISGRPVIEYV